MLSIIIVSRNCREDLKACLDSVYSQETEDFEVIVVDNGSTDGTVELVNKNYGRAKLIANRENLGACKARNQAIGSSRGEWVLTLDSDCVLQRGFISGFLSAESGFSPHTGMVAPNILNADGKTIYSQGIYLTKLRRFYDLNRDSPRGDRLAAGKKMIGPCSASAFYRRAMLNRLREDTGYFDERFFFLVEDVDLAWRAGISGWSALFFPLIECRHRGDSSKTGKDLRQYLCWRNRRLMIRKNEALAGKLLVYSIGAPYDLARLILLVFSNKYFWRRFERS